MHFIYSHWHNKKYTFNNRLNVFSQKAITRHPSSITFQIGRKVIKGCADLKIREGACRGVSGLTPSPFEVRCFVKMQYHSLLQSEF